MRSAVQICRKAFSNAQRAGLVALSLGAYGATMVPSQEYTGRYPPEMSEVQGLYRFHKERVLCFANDTVWEDIDIVAFETLPRLAEIKAARLVMQDLATAQHNKRFWISCVFPNDDDGLPDGSSVEAVVGATLVP